MEIIFKITDKNGRKIRLTSRQWIHITTSHAEMTNYLEEIQITIEKPLKITSHSVGNLYNYYIYLKQRKYPEKFLRVIVKYLNGDGFIITANFVKRIQ